MHTLSTQITRDVHGYIVEGWWDIVGGDLEKTVRREFGIELYGNPDVVRVTSDVMGISDARSLAVLQSRRAASASVGIKVFFLAFRSITTEAQNALLKVLEEPTEGTYFFVVVPSAAALLPTLRSRLRFVEYKTKGESNPLVNEFLAASSARRLTLLGTIIKEKDTKAAHMFLDDLLLTLYDRGGAKYYRVLENVLRARRHVPDRGASLKLLLEHIALVVPPKLKL